MMAAMLFSGWLASAVRFAVLALSLMCVSCQIMLPPHLSRSDLNAMQGVWLSDGYGYLMALDREDLELFNVTSLGCYDEPVELGELAYEFTEFESLGADRIRLAEGPGSPVSLNFDRVDSIESVCPEILGSSPPDVLRAFAGNLTDYYPFFELHGIDDWRARVTAAERAVSTLSTNQQLEAHMLALLDGVRDSHVGLHAVVNGATSRTSRRYVRDLDPLLEPRYEAGETVPDAHGDPVSRETISYAGYRRLWVEQQRERTLVRVLGKHRSGAADGKLAWGRVGKVGYLNIRQFARLGKGDSLASDRQTVHAALDRVMADLADVESMVVDVSLSRGGFADIAFAIAGRFVPDTTPGGSSRYLAHQKYIYSSVEQRLDEAWLEASDRTRFQGPVLVVTSDVTTSAAEEFVLAMRALPNVRTVGSATNGSLSDLLEKRLPNGWAMALSHQVYLDADDVKPERHGIAPDITYPLYEYTDDLDGLPDRIWRLVDGGPA